MGQSNHQGLLVQCIIMHSLRLVLLSLLALIILSGSCQGESVEDSSDVQLLLAPAIESKQVLDREIRSSFTKTKNSRKEKHQAKRRIKAKNIKRKRTQIKKVGKGRKNNGIKYNSNTKGELKKERKRKHRKTKGNKKNSKRKSISRTGRK